MDNIDTLIDQFVDKINNSPQEPCSLMNFDCTPSVCTGVEGEFGYEWKIKPFSKTTWIVDLEKELDWKFPPSFRSLVTRYIFPEIELDDVMLFANTPEGIDQLYELRTAIFKDQALAPNLLANGFLQFGRFNYDPICFYVNKKDSDGEYPIVCLDHEKAFDNEMVIVENIASSFLELIKKPKHTD